MIDSLQLTAKHKVATPVNWKQGEDVIIAGSVSDEDAKKQYPQGWKAPRPYESYRNQQRNSDARFFDEPTLLCATHAGALDTKVREFVWLPSEEKTAPGRNDCVRRTPIQFDRAAGR